MNEEEIVEEEEQGGRGDIGHKLGYNYGITDKERALLALRSAPYERLVTNQIYNYIEHFFPEKARSSSKWKNSIRHALATSPYIGSVEKEHEQGQAKQPKQQKQYCINEDSLAIINEVLSKGAPLLVAIRSLAIPAADRNRTAFTTYSDNPKIPYYLRKNVTDVTQDKDVFNISKNIAPDSKEGGMKKKYESKEESVDMVDLSKKVGEISTEVDQMDIQHPPQPPISSRPTHPNIIKQPHKPIPPFHHLPRPQQSTFYTKPLPTLTDPHTIVKKPLPSTGDVNRSYKIGGMGRVSVGSEGIFSNQNDEIRRAAVKEMAKKAESAPFHRYSPSAVPMRGNINLALHNKFPVRQYSHPYPPQQNPLLKRQLPTQSVHQIGDQHANRPISRDLLPSTTQMRAHHFPHQSVIQRAPPSVSSSISHSAVGAPDRKTYSVKQPEGEGDQSKYRAITQSAPHVVGSGESRIISVVARAPSSLPPSSLPPSSLPPGSVQKFIRVRRREEPEGTAAITHSISTSRPANISVIKPINQSYPKMDSTVKGSDDLASPGLLDLSMPKTPLIETTSLQKEIRVETKAESEYISSLTATPSAVTIHDEHTLQIDSTKEGKEIYEREELEGDSTESTSLPVDNNDSTIGDKREDRKKEDNLIPQKKFPSQVQNTSTDPPRQSEPPKNTSKSPIKGSTFKFKAISREEESALLATPTVSSKTPFIVTKATHTALPLPKKREERDKHIRFFVNKNHSFSSMPIRKASILSRPPKKFEIKEAPRSQMARSLIQIVDKSEEKVEIIEKVEAVEKVESVGVSRRVLEKEKAAERDKRGEMNVPIGDNEEEDDGDIVFEGTSKKKRIKMDSLIKFDNLVGFAGSAESDDDRFEMDNLEDALKDLDDDEEEDWDESPYKDSVVEFTVKATEKEREEEKDNAVETDEKAMKALRRKEIKQLKKEGKEVERKKYYKVKDAKKVFNPLEDRFLECATDGIARRERDGWREFMTNKAQGMDRLLPFYHKLSSDTIQKSESGGDNRKRENQRVHYVRVNPNWNLPYVISGGVNRSIHVHSYTTGSLINNYRPHYTYSTDAAWSHCGKYFIAVGTDKLVAIVQINGYPPIYTRFYGEVVPVGARFTQDRNIAVVALDCGNVDVFDVREKNSRIAKRTNGLPEITCIDTNPEDWGIVAIGCKNGLVKEWNFVEDHKKSGFKSSFFQYFVPGMEGSMFNCIPTEEFTNYLDISEVKSVRYCASHDSKYYNDLVVTKANRDVKWREGGDTAYKFSPGMKKSVIAYRPPKGLNLTCATLAFNYRYGVAEDFVVAGTEEGVVVAFDAQSGKPIKGGTTQIDDQSWFNGELRRVSGVDKLALATAYIPIRKYFAHESSTFDPLPATQITAIDAIPDIKMGAFVVGGYGSNPNIDVFRFQEEDDEDIDESLFHL